MLIRFNLRFTPRKRIPGNLKLLLNLFSVPGKEKIQNHRRIRKDDKYDTILLNRKSQGRRRFNALAAA